MTRSNFLATSVGCSCPVQQVRGGTIRTTILRLRTSEYCAVVVVKVKVGRKTEDKVGGLLVVLLIIVVVVVAETSN